MVKFKSISRVIWHLFDRFSNEGCGVAAAYLAYCNLFSIVPVIVVTITIISWVPGAESIAQGVEQFIISNFISASAMSIQSYLTQFVANAQQLTWLTMSSVGLLAVWMVYTVSYCFNKIWHTHGQRPFWKSLLIYMIILVLFPLLLAIGFGITAFIMRVPLSTGRQLSVAVPNYLLFLLSNLVNFVLFTTLTWLLPATRVPLRAAAAAGGVTAVLFEVAKFGFALYVQHVATYQLLYGALAIIPVFLFWLYVVWSVILLGTLVGNYVVVGIPQLWS